MTIGLRQRHAGFCGRTDVLRRYGASRRHDRTYVEAHTSDPPSRCRDGGDRYAITDEHDLLLPVLPWQDRGGASRHGEDTSDISRTVVRCCLSVSFPPVPKSARPAVVAPTRVMKAVMPRVFGALPATVRRARRHRRIHGQNIIRASRRCESARCLRNRLLVSRFLARRCTSARRRATWRRARASSWSRRARVHDLVEDNELRH